MPKRTKRTRSRSRTRRTHAKRVRSISSTSRTPEKGIAFQFVYFFYISTGCTPASGSKRRRLTSPTKIIMEEELDDLKRQLDIVNGKLKVHSILIQDILKKLKGKAISNAPIPEPVSQSSGYCILM